LTTDTEWLVFNDAVSSTPGVTVTGLSNGSAYDFRVSAETLVGPGPFDGVNSITPVGVPFAPSGLTANPGTKSMTLNWTEPSNGGSAITGYVIEYRKEIETVWTVVQHNSLIKTFYFYELDVAEYRFRVAAKNGEGTGAYSTEVLATPYGPPAQPTNLEFTADETGSMQTLSWSPSVSNAPDIPSYVVRYRLAEGTSWTAVADTNDQDESIDLSSLNLGQDNYEFEITATTSSGSSSPLSIVSLANLQAVRGNRNVSLSWSAGSASNVIDYIIESKNLTENAEWETVVDGVSPTSSAIVSNLINGDSYSFRIRAVLSSGVGVVMTIGPVVPAGVPSFPTNLTATLTSLTGPVQLNWTQPSK